MQKARGHRRQHGQGLVRRAQHQPDARSGEVRQGHHGLHHAPAGKASQFIARTKRNLAAEFTYKDTPLFAEARAISKFAQDMFLKGEVDAVDVLFTNFINTLTQKPEVRAAPAGRRNQGRQGRACAAQARRRDCQGAPTEYLFEPGAEAVLGALLPH